MIYKFYAFGHPNIQATHKTTLEFTKDEYVSLRGDCIIGIDADFDLKSLKKFIKTFKNNKVTITIKTISKSTKIEDFRDTSKIKDFAVQKIQEFSRTENQRDVSEFARAHSHSTDFLVSKKMALNTFFCIMKQGIGTFLKGTKRKTKQRSKHLLEK